MRILTTTILMFFTFGCLFAQVSNVRMVQRTDGNLMVDIYYDFSNPEGYDAKFLGIEASDDNGTTWDLNCSSISGDLSEDITVGTNYHIVWDFYADNPGISGDQFKVRVLYSFFSTMTGNDGTVYKTVKIGDQWWMAENLRETKFRDGMDIDNVTDTDIWQQAAQYRLAIRCVYDNNENNANAYGYLYNGYAAINANLPPVGWHVSTDDDWKEMEMFLGMSQTAADKVGLRGTDQGYQLKSTTGWINNGNGNNQSGFALPPGGDREMDGPFVTITSSACFWTSTDENMVSTYCVSRSFSYYSKGIWRDESYEKAYGFSIRLVKDD